MITGPVVQDVSQLPTHASGAKNPLWWGTQFFMVIEGLGFAFAIATYLYFYAHNDTWPLGPQPGLLWSSLLAGIMIASEVPNVWTKKAATKRELGKVRIGLIIMSLVGLVAVALRWFEFSTLHINYGDNAYGSIVWFLLGLHTLHLLTDLGETIVIAVLVHIGPVDLRRFPEVEDNQDYWHFVVGFWLVIYLTIYWIPRWFEVAP